VLWSSLAINTSYTFFASVTDVASNTATTATVSAFTLANHIKTKLIKTLKDEILQIVPKQMQRLNNKKVVEITY
jgi:hypothetical protein